jgi:hypothetical protein
MAIRYRSFKNIVIAGPPAHQRDVVAQLDKVWASWTGWAVLRSVIDSRKTVTIVPLSADDERKHPRAGGGYVTPGWWLGMWDATPAGEKIFRGGEDDPSTPQDERYRTVPLLRGTGRGTDAEMHFSPRKIDDFGEVPPCPRDGTVSTGRCRLGRGTATHGPDDLLVHEMVHALRFARGLLNSVPTWDKGYDNEEEFFAILVANIYSSEKGRTRLRAGHHGYVLMPEEMNTSEGFLGKGVSPPWRGHLENRQLIQKFVCQNYGLCAQLCEKVTAAAFNPIREFMRNSQLYPLYPR